MTIETCYQKLGGDYQDTLARIPTEALIRRFLGAFLKDPSFDQLCCAMDAGDRPSAFRAAHTLKGVCANLGLEKLRQSAGGLTEELRPEQDKIPAEAFSRMEELRRDYRTAEDAISQLLTEK